MRKTEPSSRNSFSHKKVLYYLSLKAATLKKPLSSNPLRGFIYQMNISTLMYIHTFAIISGRTGIVELAIPPFSQSSVTAHDQFLYIPLKLFILLITLTVAGLNR